MKLSGLIGSVLLFAHKATLLLHFNRVLIFHFSRQMAARVHLTECVASKVGFIDPVFSTFTSKTMIALTHTLVIINRSADSKLHMGLRCSQVPIKEGKSYQSSSLKCARHVF